MQSVRDLLVFVTDLMILLSILMIFGRYFQTSWPCYFGLQEMGKEGKQTWEKQIQLSPWEGENPVLY